MRSLPPLLLALAVAAAVPAPPAAAAYDWQLTCTTPSAIVSSRPINLPSENSVASVAIGFPFPFYGIDYSTLYLSSNGWLSFTNPAFDSAPASQPIPSPVTPDNLIAYYWSDLLPVAAGTRASATVSGSLLLQVRATEKTSGDAVDVSIELHPTGNIRVFFGAVGTLAGVAVGVENEGASEGLELWQNGPVPGGLAAIATGTAFELFPPSRLISTTREACGTSRTWPNGPADTLTRYPWQAGSYNAYEQAVSIAPAQPSQMTATISGYLPRNLSLWLLPGDPGDDLEPLAGPLTTVTLPVAAPGAYTLLVDGPTAGDLGPTTAGFTLATTCTPLPALACNATVSGSNTGPSRVSSWNCGSAADLGPEAFYRVTVPDGGTLDLSLVSAANLDVVVLDAEQFRLGCSGCRDWDNGAASVPFLAPGTTLVVGVDGRTVSDSGPFQLTATCSRNLDCSRAIPIDLANPGVISGTTVGGRSDASSYTCAFDAVGRDGPDTVTGLTGPERIYSFTVAPDETVALHFASANPDLVPLLLQSCNAGFCQAAVSCGEALPPGTWYLVVDGRNGASGAFTLSPEVLQNPAYSRWYECPECCDAQCLQFLDPLSHTESRHWRFASYNNCGTGCDFALYAVVDCGSEFHFPLYDAETFRVRAWDFQRSRYATLTATNDLPLNPPTVERFTLTGTEVSWDDRSCSPAPPCPSGNCGGTPSCGGGSDPATRAAIVDIRFADPESACGIYRLEFASMGGGVWDLYGNCTGDRTETWPIYRDLCQAMDAWQPLPQLTLENVVIDSSLCPDPQVSFRVRNLGCAAAPASQVLLHSDGGEPDVPVSVPSLAPFASSDHSLPFPLAGASRTLTLTADGVPAAGSVAECLEASNPMGCGGLPAVVHSTSRLICAPCSVTASAGPNATICATDPAPLDASGSVPDTCTSGLLYRWEEVGNPGNFRDFAADPTWTGQYPATDTSYRVTVQCQGSPACQSNDEVTVFVTPPQAPGRIGNSLFAVRAGQDIDWSWSQPASGPPPVRYRLYRDTTRTVDQATRTLALETLAPLLQGRDTAAVPRPGSPMYYQAVAASCGAVGLEGPY